MDAAGLGDGPIRLAPIGDGHSNLTYLVRRGSESWVLRRPPRGPLPPSAHDVLREFRILSVAAGSARVPEPIAACGDTQVIGAPFYLMSFIEGEVLTTDLPTSFDPSRDPPRIAAELIDALVEIHTLPWRDTDLVSLTSRHDAYLARQLRRFSSLRSHNFKRELPVIDTVTAWLEHKRPTSRAPTLVHGDYRLGNTVFSKDSPTSLRAVLDWELATIGDPLADLGYLTATWATSDGLLDPLVRLGAVTALPGFPPSGALVERYATATGTTISDLTWYQVLALWKSAIFLEGSYSRLLEGATDDPFFATLKTGVPELAERAWELAEAA
jgi:aminoglycoside phosphotransferase (APT) family kinase protein